jgi:tetratricopeptide (TPR) repeat protein
MKGNLIFILIFFISSIAFAQTITGTDLLNALKNGDAVKAKELADKAINQTSANTDASLWYYRAQIYLSIFSASSADVQKLSPDALEQSYNAYLKSLTLDKEKKYNKDTYLALSSIAAQFNYEGANLFNQKQYQQALTYFENGIYIGKLPAINKIDTITYYNAAIAAEKTGDFQKSISYYELLKQYKFGRANIYLELGKLYGEHDMGDKCVETFKQGISLFPEESSKFYSELINYYLKHENKTEALTCINDALRTDDKNAVLYFIKGSLTEQDGKESEAEELYKKSLAIQPTYQDALYNLGALYYNRATDLIKKAMTKNEQNQAFEIYKNAQQYLETYNNNYSREQLVLKMLKTIYTLTNQPDKLNQVNEWLKEF